VFNTMGKTPCKGGSKNSKNFLTDVTVIPFKTSYTFNASASGNNFLSTDLIVENLGARVGAMYQFFKKWRLVKLKVKVFTDCVPVVDLASGNNGVIIAGGYVGAPEALIGATPTTLQEIYAFNFADMGRTDCRFSVPRKALDEERGAPWLFTSVVATDSKSAGTLYLGLQIGQSIEAGSVRVTALITGLVELCEPTVPLVGSVLSAPCRIPTKLGTCPEAEPVGDEKVPDALQPSAVAPAVINSACLTSREMRQLSGLMAKLANGQPLPSMQDWVDATTMHDAEVLSVDEE